MPRPLLPSGYAREDTRSDAIQRPENDAISSTGGIAIYIVEIKSTDLIQFRANLLTLGRGIITITTMRTVSLAKVKNSESKSQLLAFALFKQIYRGKESEFVITLHLLHCI